MANWKLKLSFNTWDLPTDSFKWFESNGLLTADYNGCWMDIPTLIGLLPHEGDIIEDEITLDTTHFPKSFWVDTKIPAEIRTAILHFWQQYPQGVVEWTT